MLRAVGHPECAMWPACWRIKGGAADETMRSSMPSSAACQQEAAGARVPAAFQLRGGRLLAAACHPHDASSVPTCKPVPLQDYYRKDFELLQYPVGNITVGAGATLDAQQQ